MMMVGFHKGRSGCSKEEKKNVPRGPSNLGPSRYESDDHVAPIRHGRMSAGFGLWTHELLNK